MARLLLALLLLIGCTGVTAAAADGLGQALDRQQQDIQRQQSQMQETTDAQRQQLQQQQEQTLRFQLLQPSRPLICRQVGLVVSCQ